MKRNNVQAMAPERFRTLLDRLGLTQRAAARFLGFDDRTSRRYASGDSPIDPRTAMLLEVMAKTKTTPEEALKMTGVNMKEAYKRAGENAEPRFWSERMVS